jgi:hypothetical protein
VDLQAQDAIQELGDAAVCVNTKKPCENTGPHCSTEHYQYIHTHTHTSSPLPFSVLSPMRGSRQKMPTSIIPIFMSWEEVEEREGENEYKNTAIVVMLCP